MSQALSIAVLVSTRIDPVSGRATRSRGDAAAVALAQQAFGAKAQVAVYAAGAMPDAVVREYLGLGVPAVTRLVPREPQAGFDAVAALERACRSHPVVLTGARAESGLGSGMLPYLLAQRWQRPLVTDVIDIEPGAGGALWVTRALPRGARQRVQVDPSTAVVLATSARLASRGDLPLRHAWKAAQAGRIEQDVLQVADEPGPAWQYEPPRKQRRPLVAASKEGGASRMARATGAGDAAQRAAALVLADGDADAKARALLDHLRKLALVQR